jgi:hypothetical protein
MFLLNNQTNIVQMSMKGLTGTPTAGATSKAAVVSLDPSGSISTASPYIQNCTSVNANATGIQIDGNYYIVQVTNQFLQMTLHKLTQMVKVFTQLAVVVVRWFLSLLIMCKIIHMQNPVDLLEVLNCSSAYGEQGAVADGTLAAETPVKYKLVVKY